MSALFQRRVLPAFLLTSVIIGGGYATGREFAEFFLSRGPWEGLVGVGAAAVLFGGVYAASLEFARRRQTFEYRGFFKALLGRGWPLFEIVYLLMTVLTLSVFAAICAAVLGENLGWPEWAGASAFMAAAALLASLGSVVLERYIVAKTVLLFVFYGVFVGLCLAVFGEQAKSTFSTHALTDGLSALGGGVVYAGYNLSAMIATLFCARHLRSSTDAVTSGLLGGAVAMAPGAVFYIAMAAFYPSIVTETVPIDRLLNALGQPIFKAAFLSVLFATLVGTGAALLHAVNERIAEARRLVGATTPWALRAAAAATIMVCAVAAASKIGLTALVAKGYGLITFAFIGLYAAPILLWGVWALSTAMIRKFGRSGGTNP